MAKLKKSPDSDLLIKNYILNGCKNAKQAAIDAHYSPKTAEQSASRVLRSVKAKELIAEYRAASLESFIWTKQDKLKKLELIADSCMEICEEEGNFNKGKMYNPSAAITAIKEHNLMQGDNAPVESNTNIKVEQSLAEKLTGGSKR